MYNGSFGICSIGEINAIFILEVGNVAIFVGRRSFAVEGVVSPEGGVLRWLDDAGAI